MARMVIVYRTPADVEAFRRRYFETHAPLAKKLPGLRRYEVSRRADRMPRRTSSDAYMIATLHFNDMAALRSALCQRGGAGMWQPIAGNSLPILPVSKCSYSRART